MADKRNKPMTSKGDNAMADTTVALETLAHEHAPRHIRAVVTSDTAERLKDAAKRQSVTRDDVVEAALDAYLDSDSHSAFGERTTLILRRLDHMDTRYHLLNRDVLIANESIALFARFFLTVVPPIPVDERDAARALGQKRFEHYLEQIGRRIAGGHNLVREVVDTFVAEATSDDQLENLDDGTGNAGTTDNDLRVAEDNLPPANDIAKGSGR